MSWTTPLRPILRTGETLLDRVLCVLGAVAFAQLPEFIQQYRQRLGGHLDEARRHLAEFEAIATRAKLTLPQFIERTAANSDSVVADLSSVMRNTLLRIENLTTTEAALRDASVWKKPFVFLTHLYPTIAQATWDIYRPAVPTTPEGFLYAAVGMLTFLGLYHGVIRYPIAAAMKRRRNSTEKSRADGR